MPAWTNYALKKGLIKRPFREFIFCNGLTLSVGSNLYFTTQFRMSVAFFWINRWLESNSQKSLL